MNKKLLAIVVTAIVIIAGGVWWYVTDILPEKKVQTEQSPVTTQKAPTEETCSPRGTGTCDGNGRPITSAAPSPDGATTSNLKSLTAEQIGSRTVALTGKGSQGLDFDSETGIIYVGNQGSATCANKDPKLSVSEGGDSLSVIDPVAGKETAHVASGVSPIWPLVDEKRGVVYVAGSGGSLIIHERGTGTKKKSIDIGRSPHAVGLSTDGIIVVSNTNDGSQKYYAALNADTQKLITHHKVIDYPHSIVYHQANNLFYMIGVEDGKVAEIDGKTGETKSVFSANAVDGNSAMIALAEQANKLFVGISEPKGGMNVIDLSSKKIVATVASDGNIPATSVAVDESRGLVFLLIPDKDLVQVIDMNTYKSLATLPVGDCPFGVRVDPTRGLGAVTNQIDHSLTIFDLNKLTQAVK